MKKKLLFVWFCTLFLISCGQYPKPAIQVEMTDFAFTPNKFTVPAGSEVTLKVDHEGVVTHDFIIMRFGENVGEHFNEEDLPNVYWQVEVQPGEKGVYVFTAPNQPGVYQLVCGMAGHVEAGMIGTLEVVAAR